jgi:hypothetical protein
VTAAAQSAAGAFFCPLAELQKLTLMVSFAQKGQYLQGRAFKGLMQNNGRDQPSVLEQGRYGVAQGYREFE